MNKYSNCPFCENGNLIIQENDSILVCNNVECFSNDFEIYNPYYLDYDDYFALLLDNYSNQAMLKCYYKLAIKYSEAIRQMRCGDIDPEMDAWIDQIVKDK